MKQTSELFKKEETEVVVQSVSRQLQEVEQTIRNLSEKRQLLKGILEKVRAERPIDAVVEQTPVRNLYSDKFEENKSIAAKINFILAQSEKPLTSAEVTERYISLVPSAGNKKHKIGTLKNVSTILSIGEGKKYEREKNVAKKYVYKLKQEQIA